MYSILLNKCKNKFVQILKRFKLLYFVTLDEVHSMILKKKRETALGEQNQDRDEDI